VGAAVFVVDVVGVREDLLRVRVGPLQSQVDDGRGKTGIREIKFVGNHAISNYRLGGLMQTSTMNLLSFIKSTDVYDPDRLASDEEATKDKEHHHGFMTKAGDCK
jgi:outer membrane protein assembly factor BamA